MHPITFLEHIAKFTLINTGLAKRILATNANYLVSKRLKVLLENDLITKHEYGDFTCYSLSQKGFKAIGINHTPKYDFEERTAKHICFANHLRFGIEKEFEKNKLLELERWWDGATFKKDPLVVKVKNGEYSISPYGAFIINDQSKKRLFFIDVWEDFDQIYEDTFLYFLYKERKLFLYKHFRRYFLEADTPINVLILIRGKSVFKEHFSKVRSLKAQDCILFVPQTKILNSAPFSQSIWITADGREASILKS